MAAIDSDNFELSTRLREEGAEVINQLIADQTEETLHIEFKTLSDVSGDRLMKDDRRMLAKAICGIANADGGVIIIGVETKRIDNVDVAVGKKLIAKPDALRNRITAAVPEILSPQHPQISVYLLLDRDQLPEGFVVIEVPKSDSRPHYSNVHHQYFRRGSDGTRALEHSEIRELMFIAREALLDIECKLRHQMSTGDHRYGLMVTLTLQNRGKVPAIAPYVRINNGMNWRRAPIESLGSRPTSTGAHGIYSTRDLLIHVEDEIGIAECDTGLDFRRTGQISLPAAIDSVKKNGPNSFVMAPFSEMPGQGFTISDRLISVSGTYGAENAAAKQFAINIGKMDLFQLFCAHYNL